MHHSLSGVIENAAYIAIGADSAFLDRELFQQYDGGHVELICECVEHAELLERLFQEKHDELCGYAGVFAYDVCEPFGKEYVTALILGEKPDAESIARRLIEESYN